MDSELSDARAAVAAGRGDAEDLRARVRNHKDQAINVRCVEHLRACTNWKVAKTTDPWIKHDFQTFDFEFGLWRGSGKGHHPYGELPVVKDEWRVASGETWGGLGGDLL